MCTPGTLWASWGWESGLRGCGLQGQGSMLTKQRQWALKSEGWGFPGGAVVENLPANAGDTGSSPGLGRSHMPRSN